VYPGGVISQPVQVDAGTITRLPAHLRLFKYGDYISNLVKRFEDVCHDGPASSALETGREILSIYTLIYPSIHPLIGEFFGTHGNPRSRSFLFAAYAALELAKVCWNAEIKSDKIAGRSWLELASEVLEVAEQMFVVLGPEDGARSRSSALEVVDHLKGLIADERPH
jgi:hypothetical protein